MEFSLPHPDDRRRIARYGFDAERGCYATIAQLGQTVVFDAASCCWFDNCDPVLSVVMFLVKHAFLGANDVADAFVWLGGGEGLRGWPGGRRRRPRRGSGR